MRLWDILSSSIVGRRKRTGEPVHYRGKYDSLTVDNRDLDEIETSLRAEVDALRARVKELEQILANLTDFIVND